MSGQHQLRSDAACIWTAALRAVDPAAAVRRFVSRTGSELAVGERRFDLDKVKHVWVLGAGKAAAPMAQALEKILAGRLTGGVLVTRYGHSLPLKKLELMEAGHPLPDANSVAAGARIAHMAESQITPRDLVFCLLSGGGSALLAAPAPGITWEEKLLCTRLLLNSGATIRETNAIRKHISSLKGGGLARLLASVPVISLILSDVVGDELDSIASGPLVPDTTTFLQCEEILRKLQIEDLVPPAVRKRLKAGAGGRIPENPRPGDPIFRRKIHLIVGSNAQACGAAARTARRLGYHALVLTSRLEGDTGEAARFHLSILREIVAEGRPLRRPACLISGGETTVRVLGKGSGGRNQEFSLHCVRGLAHLPAPCVAASLATDGTDGPTDAAGALVDNTALARSLRFGAAFFADCLNDNNSYEFFRRLGDLIVTGPTRTNVMDLHMLLVG
ncbi:MAG: glycerate kinase [Acidobacteriia bacterium]|nr:glycerate kinase [Terriglobia bacterium]